MIIFRATELSKFVHFKVFVEIVFTEVYF